MRNGSNPAYYQSYISKIDRHITFLQYRCKFIKEKYDVIDTPLRPMEDLRSIPVDTSTTSFFETDGSRTGYVKGSYKPLERILMSWWSFDLRVGEDKEYYPMEKTDPIFYTSLKYWDREDSDMRNFPRFLKYWGWNL